MEQFPGSKHIHQYSLSIRFSSDGFSLSIYDEANKLLTTKTVSGLLSSFSADEIVLLLHEDTETLLDIQHVRLISVSDNYAFVPVPIFREDEADVFLQLQDKPEKNSRVLFNLLPKWDMVNVFSMPSALFDALTELYPEVSIEHHLSWFLTEKIKMQSDSSIQIWVRPKMMDVVALKAGNVILINSYVYQTPEDFVYFTLNIFEQLSLNTEKDKVRLFNVQTSADLQKHLLKYLKYCEIAE